MPGRVIVCHRDGAKPDKQRTAGPDAVVKPRTAGLDAGATLWKLAIADPDDWDVRLLDAGDVAGVKAWLETVRPQRIGLTGGGANALVSQLDSVEARVVAEFDAWIAGAPDLARAAGLALPETYLLASVGTGVSVSRVSGDAGERIAGLTVGGGTLLGLAELLLGTRDFDRIVELAQRGDRRRVDLSIGDIYPLGDAPRIADAPAAHFAKLDSREPADVAAALVAMLGHAVALVCAPLARAQDIGLVIYCGTTLRDNTPLVDALRWQTEVYGLRAAFPTGGAFCGALGAARLAAR